MKFKNSQQGQASNYLLAVSLVLAAVLIGGTFVFKDKLKTIKNAGDVKKNEISAPNTKSGADQVASGEPRQGREETADLEEKIIPSAGVELPVKWGDLGKRLVEAGAIDAEKFEEIYNQRGGLTEENKKMLYAESGKIIINRDNSGFVLNMFWALGLANKNPILEKGPMVYSKYGGAENFASTGGWTLSRGGAMSHYSKHQLIILNSEQQVVVERVSKNIYRPCCNNSTYFPDCNHGMAMLGLLELMASQGISELEMYRVALAVNSYWFPDTYLTIAKYFQGRGIDWPQVDAKEVLGIDYSSGSGYRNILSKVKPSNTSGGGGCGI